MSDDRTINNSVQVGFIERARALDAAATEGPWRVDGSLIGPRKSAKVAHSWGVRWTSDAEFIASARTMLPAAVEALARVRELHYRVTTCHLGDDAYCHHDGLAWPCMTIMATEVEA